MRNISLKAVACFLWFYYMFIPDVSQSLWFMITFVVFFAIIVGRYFLVSGLFYLIFYAWFPARFKQRKISKKEYASRQFKREISRSMTTALIFAFIGTVMILLWEKGYTAIYTDINAYGWWWLPVSLIISMLLDETYYYWVHRLLHKPKLFKLIHKVHHQSNITSPWTAFSFHPFEGLLLSVSLPVILMIVPMHPVVILLQLTIMTFSSVINHLDIEIYPARFHKHVVGKWLIGATHHGLHHKQFKYNFGLYFTFWDKWKKTESPLFDETFKSATTAKPY
jgi:Delta7-sterol 5-desaturase